jgi:hypothetical protein
MPGFHCSGSASSGTPCHLQLLTIVGGGLIVGERDRASRGVVGGFAAADRRGDHGLVVGPSLHL